MSKYIPASTYNLALNKIGTADRISICTQQPVTYFEAAVASLWESGKTYSVGDLCRPPTDNNKIYECTIDGTSGAGEPSWGVVDAGTFIDGSVTWKTHPSYSLAEAVLEVADKVIADGSGGGRQITFAEKSGITSFRGGVVTHTAYLNSIDKTIEAITTSTTTAPADDLIIAGRTIIFHSSVISFRVS